MTRTTGIHTIGHSNHRQSTFLDLIRDHGMQTLIDIRTHPYSRRNPQFNRESLESALRAINIKYVWMGHELGGLRKPEPHSRHTGLEADGFRGYADHMESNDFRCAATRLLGLACETDLVLMCAEADPNRCHRQFVCDYITVQETPVTHILADGSTRSHQPHECLRVMATQLIYDRGNQQTLF